MAIKQKGWEQDEFVIAEQGDRLRGNIECRTDCFPHDASYFRIVDCRGSHERELMYWSADEWCEDSSAMGAIFAVIGLISHGNFNPDLDIYKSHADACEAGEDNA